MEVAGVVFRQAPCFSSSVTTMKQSRSFVYPKQRLEFSDKSHLQYYNGPRMEVKEKEVMSKKKEMKKKLKLLKGLSKNLSTFSEMGFGLNPDTGLDHQVKGQMISEATEVLLGQLQKLKAEEMEYKMKKKEEKAKKKAARMMLTDCKDSSSSSSSESDCEKNIMTMTQIKTKSSPIMNQEAPPTPSLSVQTPVESRITEKKIEVCMGGKCKKSGGAMLMENFQKAVGGEAEVVGCKCMGKCKEGPNVRVVNSSSSSSNGDGNRNPLCIGVGLEDVDSIVSNFFGGNHQQLPATMFGV